MGILDAPGLSQSSADLRYSLKNDVRPSTIPSNQTLAKRFWPEKAAYNITSASTARARAAASKALAGAGRFDICTIGTSITAGTGAAAKTSSWPATFHALQLTRGFADGGSGFIAGQSNLSATPETRVTLGTGWTPYSANTTPLVQGTSTSGSLTFADTRPSTSITIHYIDYFTFQLNWTIDGVAQTPITLGNTGNWKSVTVSGLTSANHTVVITPGTGAASGTPAYICGVQFNNAKGITVHNLGIGGITTGSASTTSQFSPFTLAKNLNPQLTIIELGTNDGANPTSYSTQMQTMITGLTGQGSDVLLLGEPPVGSAGSTRPVAYVIARCYELADSNNLPLVDISERFISWASADALGLGYDTDALTVHWNESGNALIARLISNALEL